MNKTLKKWLVAGDESKAPLFNEYYKVKKRFKEPKLTNRQYKIYRLQSIELNKWLKSNKKPTQTQNGKLIHKAIPSVYFNMIKLRDSAC